MDYVVQSGNRLWGCKYGMADGRAVNEIYASKFEAPFPARSAFQVAALPAGGLVEIEVVAAL